jgi:hypothetical protein
MKLKTVAMTGMMSLAGLGLVGAGAHAVFTATTASSQTVSAGALAVVVSSPDAPGCTTVADNCTSLTLNPVGPFGSTFDSAASLVTITNTGNIPATEISLTVSDSPINSAGLDNGGALASEMGMCFFSDGSTVWNELLPAVEAGSPYSLGASPLATSGTDSYSVDFYAGQASSQCTGPAVPALDTLAEGGSDAVTVTITYNG